MGEYAHVPALPWWLDTESAALEIMAETQAQYAPVKTYALISYREDIFRETQAQYAMDAGYDALEGADEIARKMLHDPHGTRDGFLEEFTIGFRD